MTFTPTRDFFCEVNQSHYCVGLCYTARNEDMEALARSWIERGMATERPDQARTSGIGVVA